MQQELSKQDSITLIGLSGMTSYQQELKPETSVIADLVAQYNGQNIAAKIHSRSNPGITIAAYTDYESDEYGAYRYFIGEEVESLDNIPDGLSSLVVPAGKYLKFTTEPGRMPTVLIVAWKYIWHLSEQHLEGKRSYKTDFEVYDNRAKDINNSIIDIYVGLK